MSTDITLTQQSDLSYTAEIKGDGYTMEIPNAALAVVPYEAPVAVDPPVAPPVAQPVSTAPALKADFSYVVNGLTATFTDKSTGAASVRCGLGNGSTPVACPVGGNLTHTYSKSEIATYSKNGTFSVVWEATDASGKTVSKWGSVTISP